MENVDTGRTIMELHEALVDIATIRRQIAAAEQFRGYRAWPIALGALLALGGAAIQPLLVADPSRDLRRYLALWVGIAIVAGAVPTADVFRRHFDRGSLQSTLRRIAFDQFSPCVVAGALLTWVVANHAPDVAWLLPGLWAVLFSLGMFASGQLLPRAVFVVGGWYLLCGLVCIALGPDQAGLAPWTMGMTFGAGQLGSAVVCAWQERDAVDDAQ